MVTRTDDVDKLIAEYIEPNPYKSGRDQVRIVGAGVSVWAFIANLHAINDDLTQGAKDYELPREAAEAAVHYYRRYKDLIDARIAVNEAAFNSDAHPADC